MAKTKTSKYAILGLLLRKPSTGYELRRAMELETQHFWSEGFSQIYPVLHDLVRDGLAERVTESQEKRPDRQIYSATAAGREAFARWLHDPPQLNAPRNELLLKLFLGGSSSADLIDLVAGYREKQLEIMEELADLERSYDGPTRQTRQLWQMTLRHQRSVCEAALRWCDTTIEQLEKLQWADNESGSETGAVDARIEAE